MNLAPLLTEVFITFVAAGCLLYRYGNWYRHHLVVTVAVLIAWYFSFLIAFIIPLDVTSTVYRQCILDSNHSRTDNQTVLHGIPDNSNNSDSECREPWSYVPDRVFSTLWRVVYWTSQCLTWLVLPLMQSYTRAGDFTVKGKLKSALVDNAIYYGSYLLIASVLLVYLIARAEIQLDFLCHDHLLPAYITRVFTMVSSYLVVSKDGTQPKIGLMIIRLLQELLNTQTEDEKNCLNFENSLRFCWKLKVIASSASNTWGLFWLVLLLGYGLVDVPRSLLRSSYRGYQLRYCYFKAAKMFAERTEAEENLEDIIESIRGVSAVISSNHPLRVCVETIEMKIPLEFQEKVKRRSRITDGMDVPTEKSLAKLHKQAIKVVHVYHRTETQWSSLVEKIVELEDVARNEVNSDRNFRTSNQKQRGKFWNMLHSPKIEWYWKCVFRRIFLKIFGLLLAVLSLAVVWSELTFFKKDPTLSLFALFVDLAKANYDYFTIEVLSIFTILYLCVCAYRTVFKVRVLNFYYLADNHHTDEYSLIFSGMMLCRLTPPMCLNFLGLIHMDSHVIKSPVFETHYTQIMGHMDVLPILADGFYIYFPMAIVALCAATYFSLGAKFLTFLGFQQFVGDENITGDLVEEGQELVKRERRKLERQPDSSTSMHRSASTTSRYRSLPQVEEEPDPLRQSLLRAESEQAFDQDERLLDKMFMGDKSVSYSSTDTRYTGSSGKDRRNLFDDV